VASQLSSLGTVSLRAGEYAEAIGYFRQALALFRETGNAHGQIMTLHYLGEALQAAGQTAAARAELTAVLGLAAETGNTYQQACAHRDLAESHHSAGQAEQARHHWQRAIALYSEIGAPEADQVRLSAREAERALPNARPATPPSGLTRVRLVRRSGEIPVLVRLERPRSDRVGP
jgi:tetratricopeptide (TPR) repeat protein